MMTFSKSMPLLALSLFLGLAAPLAVWAQTCETLGSVGTDGTGAPGKYRVGGTYFSVPIERLKPGVTLRIAPVSGELRYVTLHTRFKGGYWKTAYQGGQTDFTIADPAIIACKSETNCTHINVSINGAHEKYETLVSSAQVQLCQAAAPPAAFLLDSTWTAAQSGWKLSIPSVWTRDVQDNPDGGTGMFVSPDGLVVVGVSTLSPEQDVTIPAIAGEMERAIFSGAVSNQTNPTTLGGLEGETRQYRWVADGTNMTGIAIFLPAGARFYTVWAFMPSEIAGLRGHEVTKIVRTFRLTQPVETRPQPLQLTMLAIGQSPDTGKRAGLAIERFSPSTPKIYVAAVLTGTDRNAAVRQQLFYLETGQLVLETSTSVATISANQLLELTGIFEAPTNGWPTGTYRLLLTHRGQQLGSRMFIVEDAQ